MVEHLRGSSVSFVGAGRVALAIAVALDRAGWQVRSIVGRSDRARERIGALLPGTAFTTDLDPPVIDAAGVIVLAVPDDQLDVVIADLAAGDQSDWSGRTVVHASGRYGTSVLDPLARRGASVLALHPAMTFVGDTEREVLRLRDSRCALTGDPVAIDTGRSIAEALGADPFVVAEHRRALYHAALCHASNHLTVLLEQAESMLRTAGVEEPRSVLAPLVEAGVANTLETGGSALTGPVSRGDLRTVAGHLEAIRSDAPDAEGTYRVLATGAAGIALREQRIDATRAGDLEELLRRR